MLCSLPPSWDTFCTAISNSALSIGLVYNDIIGSLLTEEIQRKSMEPTNQGDAYVASTRGLHPHKKLHITCFHEVLKNPLH